MKKNLLLGCLVLTLAATVACTKKADNMMSDDAQKAVQEETMPEQAAPQMQEESMDAGDEGMMDEGSEGSEEADHAH
ncbi:MAG: hypothetical protein COX62_00720 [Deltaproteobacteria bacterium CG_4_10_14_0_2_um_filter_43_8]|nr:MAG: hypothetical protein COV43_03665 [Deltaproteobacteria bacterium CG11_big_fil_rev_8_21_14_0_20_42_23]PJA22125.1 MAG: hypothetical protein COX62_00720 [Deltaproteobacteria bacterium CG_4_10_14_0_2_um_filter_43_8]PJC64821.1 MAG: hypothetical protein CO021_02275 [Deltaproteobacteria bacterium CG_4_9_14_0_2_um_filter_42_21]